MWRSLGCHKLGGNALCLHRWTGNSPEEVLVTEPRNSRCGGSKARYPDGVRAGLPRLSAPER